MKNELNVMFTNPYYRWYRIDKIIINLFRDIQCAYQRITKGYCFRDTWEISNWFLEIMPNMLTDLKNNCHGYFGNSQEEYEAMLDKMIECFKEANQRTCSMKNEYYDTFPHYWESDNLTKEEKINQKKWFDKENEISKYQQQKLNEGLELFNNHFNELWD